MGCHRNFVFQNINIFEKILRFFSSLRFIGTFWLRKRDEKYIPFISTKKSLSKEV